jgi:hypothetical protein
MILMTHKLWIGWAVLYSKEDDVASIAQTFLWKARFLKKKMADFSLIREKKLSDFCTIPFLGAISA